MDIAVAVLGIKIQEAKAYPLAEALHKRGVPFMFVSGHQRDAVPDPFRHVKYLEKPVATGQVVRALQGMLRFRTDFAFSQVRIRALMAEQSRTWLVAPPALSPDLQCSPDSSQCGFVAE